MGIVAAGLAVAAVGAGVSAYGSSQAAGASKDAAALAALLGKKNAEKQNERLDTLLADKEEKLSDINSTLDRFGGGPSLQSQENLDLLRKAQNDYLKLAAGDFSAFEDQLKDVMASTVANSFGAGSPVGTFTQLSAQNINALRQQGINTGLQASSFLGAETTNMLGAEFTLLDEGFERRKAIDEQELAIITGAVQQRAEAQGISAAATGSALTSIGGSIATYGYGVNNGSIKGFGGGGGGGGDVATLNQTASSRPSFVYGDGGGGGYSAKSGLATNFSANFAQGGGGLPDFYASPNVTTGGGGSGRLAYGNQAPGNGSAFVTRRGSSSYNNNGGGDFGTGLLPEVANAYGSYFGG